MREEFAWLFILELYAGDIAGSESFSDHLLGSARWFEVLAM